MLKIEPIRKYKSPGYPNKKIILENPNVLKTLPQRWKGKVYAGLAFSSIALLLLSGCERAVQTVGVMPAPVNLTEEEAYSIITEEAEKYGVRFDSEGIFLENVKFDIDMHYSGNNVVVTNRQSIQLDGYDKEKKIGFEFATFDDTRKFAESIESFTDEDIRSFYIDTYAEELKEAVKQGNEEIHFEAFHTYESQDIETCKEDLRQQVTSFMEWLKSEGVI